MMRPRTCLFSVVAALAIGLSLPQEQTVSMPASTPAQSPTYYRDVQPIVAEHCVSCHSDGRSAPFSLTTYRDVEKRSEQIAQITKSACMPPWKPDSHGELIGENRLSPQEIVLLQQWADRGALAGSNTGKQVSAPVLMHEFGTPDAVLAPSSSSHLPSEGADFYRCFILPTHFDTDRYLAATVFQPGNPSACDHVLEYLDVHRQVRFMNAVSAGGSFDVQGRNNGLQPDAVIGGWGIGTPPQRFPQGSGILLPKGADIVLEVHYHPTGKPETDLPQLLLYFAKGPVTHRVRVAPVMANNLRLIPNFTDLHVGGQKPVVSDISILSVLPYLKHRGTGIRIDALTPDKSQTTILNIPQWDFDWIGDYQFVKPVRIKGGSILTMDATFSTASDAPGPSGGADRVVTWGDTTQDENAVAYVFYTTDREVVGTHPIAGVPGPGGPTHAAMDRILLKMFDTNHDGTLEKREQLQMSGFFHSGMPSMAGMEM